MWPRGPIKAKAKSSLEINKKKKKVFAENAPSAISLLRQPTGSWPNFCSSDQNQKQVLEKFWAGLPGATRSHALAMDRSLIGQAKAVSRRSTSRKDDWEWREEGGRFTARICPGGQCRLRMPHSVAERGRTSLHTEPSAVHPSLPPASL